MKDSQTDANRRIFMHRTGQLMIGGLLGSVVAHTASADHEAGFAMPSSTEGRCITCRYWGGIRKISKDGKVIITQSLGWCNNPKSMSYQKMTPPDFGPMKAWQKWDALG